MRLSLLPIVPLALFGQPRRAVAQDTRIRGFTDVTINASDRRGATSNFALGQFGEMGVLTGEWRQGRDIQNWLLQGLPAKNGG